MHHKMLFWNVVFFVFFFVVFFAPPPLPKKSGILFTTQTLFCVPVKKRKEKNAKRRN